MNKGKLEFSLVNLLFVGIVIALIVFVGAPLIKKSLSEKDLNNASNVASNTIKQVMIDHFEDYAQIDGIKIYVTENQTMFLFVVGNQGSIVSCEELDIKNEKMITTKLNIGDKYKNYFNKALVVIEKSQMDKAITLGNVVLKGFTTIFDTKETLVVKVRNELKNHFSTTADMDNIILTIDNGSGEYYEAKTDNGILTDIVKVDKLTEPKPFDMIKIYYEYIKVIIPSKITHLLISTDGFTFYYGTNLETATRKAELARDEYFSAYLDTMEQMRGCEIYIVIHNEVYKFVVDGSGNIMGGLAEGVVPPTEKDEVYSHIVIIDGAIIAMPKMEADC